MDKVAKLILNSLRCPSCGGQIDLISGTNIHTRLKDLNFSCVYDSEHYSIRFVHWEQPARIETEQVIVYVGSHQYKVTQSHWVGGASVQSTKILISKVDPEHRIIDSSKKIKEFVYDKHLFDFSKTNQEKLISRIKTILVFQ
jgi:hypothetical protein